MNTKRDRLQEARERYADAVDAMRENHARMREDLDFSNPTDPQQWPKEAQEIRKGRPCYTFDRTNQFLAQIVNDSRANKPRIQVLPVDSSGDKWTAQVIGGLIRHIEYTSRADQAYDTAIDHSARIGLGWLRVVPEVVRPETNEQEIIIKRIHDPFSVALEAGSVDPDGADATHGFVTTQMPKKRFQREYPKAKTAGETWPTERTELWGGEDAITICEYFYITEKSADYLTVQLPDGSRRNIKAGEFAALEAELGFRPMVIQAYEAMERKQTWCKMTGAEVLEETEFPCRWIPLVPVYGDELWVEGKRYLSGIVRKMRAAQQAYNMERSAAIEYVALQPKSPFIAPFEAIEAHEEHWKRLNTGNPAFLPYNHVDENGNPIPPPSRQAPPPMPAAFTALGQIASQDMESAVGMHKANLGQQGNEQSGRAIMARQREGDAATYHYQDNLVRSISHLGRIIVDMLPRIYDATRTARILGEDGKQEFVEIKPGSGQAVRENGKTLSVDLSAGHYDVRVTAGASHATQRQEAAFGLQQILASPAGAAVAPAIIPALMELQDWPNAEKYARAVKAMTPPDVRAAMEDEEEAPQIPPQVQAQMQQMQQHIAQLEQMLDAAEQEMGKVEAERQNSAAQVAKVQLDRELGLIRAELDAGKLSVDQYNAQTQRAKVEHDARMAEIARLQDVERGDAERASKEQKEAGESEALQSLAQQQAETSQAIMTLAEAMAAIQKQTASLGEMVHGLAETVHGSKTVAVEKVRGADGRMVAARVTRADGTTEEVTIQ